MKMRLAIAKRREQIGLTQEELAHYVGVSKTSISRWESGDISNMRRDRIQKLAEALKVSPLSLLEDETDGLEEWTEKNAPDSIQSDFMKIMTENEWILKIQKMTPDNRNRLQHAAEILLLSQGQADQEEK